ncbi:hypothetical protein MesoLjLc_71080 [Mesorhizobium sp. L-8-10]|uniref:hypothetical protein n=1 Tax=unclassified Mesorhizobium TaxID=325217 RepID=UPI0019360944|nr:MULTISPECIES: hypothetical protein [unclassified Mesorhizobium]BCH27232.1 hypothetical protein MesoLjLb_70170 [Mesorhizobium sp. L-8-3]BCH35178.1 hypothetical protein MesoLjLc_71080 [Mesorhizobium sp. L-8-10]
MTGRLMNNALMVAAIGEALTGAALFVAPSLVSVLLLGEDLSGIAVPVARVAGIALIGLGIACWPGPPLAGMLVYSGAVAAYLACIDLQGARAGILLWPAVILHVVLTVLLVRELVKPRR